jgi:alkanesulfonate monooxygenase SsuD/methylene tetrahydromethanopterin reductase-like flavin-dependent oxidoreductase (luciferase family)
MEAILLVARSQTVGLEAPRRWDHVVHDKRSERSFGDPWMLLTAAALATTRIKLGPMVTPVPRRRPQQLARQVSTLDNLSDGRVIFGAGLGGPIDDEGLDLLDRYWSGEAVTHDGRHYHVEDVTLLPTPVQRPRVPVWIGGFWPHRPPMRRAARWDGAIPLFLSATHGHPPPVDEVRDLVAYVRGNRGATQAGHSSSSWAGPARPPPPARATCSVR